MSDVGALKFADNKKLMVSKPSRFNDPYDCLADLVEFKTFPEEYENHPNFNRESLRKHMKQEYFPKVINGTGVSCFSETGTNMLMWSHYSNSHKGICVAYDLKEFYFSLKGHNKFNCDSTLIKINYTKDFIPLDLFKDYKTALYHWLSTKSNCWNYEKEVRIVFRDFPFNSSEDMKLIRFNKLSIKKVFLGSKMNLENQEVIIEKLKKTNPKIKFYKMERKANSFELTPKTVWP